ncbi:class I SAM-dependent methyltransferase [Methanomassiliicoccales archaeon LGM-DZ1]|nr:class I SAM-dependent methyltransferase [Methanomassiliicoccales archaeon LGM-DZ1]
MMPEDIAGRWRPEGRRPADGSDWDARAGLFDTPVPGPEDPFVALVLGKSRPDPSFSTLLDIGCGTGTYSLAMASRFRSVLGLDISPAMIGRARRKAEERGASNAEFRVSDWSAADAGRIGRHSVVIAHMTPAISSPETFAKMEAVSGGWCFYSGYISRGNPVWDEVYRITGIPGALTESDRLLYAVDILWKAGMRPRIEYIREHRSRMLSEEEALSVYLDGARAFADISPIQEREIADAVRSRLEDGRLRDESDPVIGTVYWNTEENADE